MDLNHFLHFLFGIFGNATALFLYLAPVVTFYRIIKTKSTEEFSGVPYVSALLCCLLSAWYGLPFVSPNNLLLSTIDGTGSVIELVYVIVFLIYAPKKGKAKIFGLFLVVVLVFALVVLVSLLALHGKSRKVFCGLASTIFTISMYASPLSIMRLVIRTKSVEFNAILSLPLCLPVWDLLVRLWPTEWRSFCCCEFL